MKQSIVKILAAYGAFILVMQVTAFTVGRFTNTRLAGVLFGQHNRPIANATVLLDDRSGDIKEVRTNQEGEFRFSTEASRLARTRLLICAPGMVPMYNDEQSLNNLTANQYLLAERSTPDLPFDEAASLGWQGRVPPDCLPSSKRHNTR